MEFADLGDLYDVVDRNPGDLFDRLDVGVAVTAVGSRQVRRANPAACRILGRSQPELIGLTWELHIPAPDREQVLATAEEWTRQGGADPPPVIRFARPDGSVVHVMVAAGLYEQGGLMYFVSLLLDVTDREQASYNLQVVLDNSPVSMFLTGPSARCCSTSVGGRRRGGRRPAGRPRRVVVRGLRGPPGPQGAGQVGPRRRAGLPSSRGVRPLFRRASDADFGR